MAKPLFTQVSVIFGGNEQRSPPVSYPQSATKKMQRADVGEQASALGERSLLRYLGSATGGWFKSA